MEFPKPASTKSYDIHPRNFTRGEHFQQVALNLTKERLDKLASAAIKAPTEMGKMYDWSYGVTTLTQKYPLGVEGPQFTYDTLLEVEGLFERSWRWWQKGTPQEHLLSPEDRFFRAFLTDVNSDVNLYDFKSYLNFDTPFFLSKAELQRRLNIYFSTHPLVFDPVTHKFYTKQEAEAVLEKWEKEGVTVHNAREEHGEHQIWDEDSMTPETMLIGIDFYLEAIEKKLEAAPRALFERELEVIRNPETHPVEKAARIWFFSLKHPSSPLGSSQAGRALAELTLLSHGYRAPKMTEQDARAATGSLEAFTQRLIQGINDGQKATRLNMTCTLI